jgi:integrase
VYRNPEGKQKWESGFPNKASARARLNEVLMDINRGEYVEPKTVTFKEFAENYISSRYSIRGSTSAAYASVIRRHLIPFLGKMKLQEIRLENAQRLVSHLEGKVSPKTVRNTIMVLTGMLYGKKSSSALRQGYIRSNPLLGLELPGLLDKQVVPPTAEEVWKLIDTAGEMRSPGHGIIYLGAFTGLRRGEILALTFGDIDWFQKEVLINKSLAKFHASDGSHKWTWKIGPPKSKRSNRRVALTDNAIQLLYSLKQNSQKLGDLIFRNEAGSTIDPDYFDEHLFKPIKRKAGLEGIRFHHLRHFFASMLIAQGESPKYISDQLGHSSIMVTFDTYGHLFPQAKAEAAQKLEKRMFHARERASVSNLLANEENEQAEEILPKRVN